MSRLPRLKIDHLVAHGNRLFALTLRFEDAGQFLIGGNEVGLQFNGLVVRGDGLFDLTAGIQRVAEVVVAYGKFWIDRQRALV